MRELALTFTAQRPPHPRSNTPQLHTPRLKLLAATDNPATIVTLSDQRESKGLSFRSFQVQPSRSREISNRKSGIRIPRKSYKNQFTNFF